MFLTPETVRTDRARDLLQRVIVEPGLRFETHVELAWTSTLFGAISIGAHSYLNDDCTVSGPTSIGRYCSIGRRISIGSGSHRFEWLSTHPFAYDASQTDDPLSVAKPSDPARQETLIGHDCWIGDGAVILRGVQIGTGAVIGANAVVNKDVDPYAIVGGVPARIIRFRFDESTIAALLASRWWMLNIDYLKTLYVNDPIACARMIAEDRAIETHLAPIEYLDFPGHE